MYNIEENKEKIINHNKKQESKKRKAKEKVHELDKK